MKFHYPFQKFLFIIFGATFIFLAGCQKDDSPNNNVSNDDTNDDDPINTTGRFSNHLSCTIIPVPNDVGLNNYYQKYINCSGIPIIGSNDVPDEALYLAEETLSFMLNGLNGVKSKLISDGNYIALYAEGSNLSSLPEPFPGSANSSGAYTWTGSGTNDLRALASDVASLLCRPEVGNGHVLVHEIAHMIHIGGIRLLNSNFQSQLENTYNNAVSSGKWTNTYAHTNKDEYLAEAVTIWYGVNWIGPEGGDGSRNNIGNRAQLQSYDSGIYNLINDNFNTDTAVPGCREPVIAGATSNCPSSVTDIDGNIYEVVNIGPMCWMAENLKTTRYRDGSPIENIINDADWQNTTSGAWSNYDNDPSNDAVYGKLYNAYALQNSVSMCPEGWHVPAYQELQDLTNYMGGDYTSYNWRSPELWNPPGIPATDGFSFSALPSGLRNAEGWFQEGERRTNFGSTYSSGGSPQNYYSKAIFADQEYVYNDNISKNTGMPCRCIKD